MTFDEAMKQVQAETLAVWNAVITELFSIDFDLYHSCVPDCFYKFGNCTELKPCGHYKKFKGA